MTHVLVLFCRCVSQVSTAALGPPPPAARWKPNEVDDNSFPSRGVRLAAGPRWELILPAGTGKISPGGAHCGDVPVGFYEWVELVVRVAYHTHNGAEVRARGGVVLSSAVLCCAVLQ